MKAVGPGAPVIPHLLAKLCPTVELMAGQFPGINSSTCCPGIVGKGT